MMGKASGAYDMPIPFVSTSLCLHPGMIMANAQLLNSCRDNTKTFIEANTSFFIYPREQQGTDHG
jgi:hypothetical protein